MTTAPRRLGRYELRQQVGRGNVGEVWRAYDLQEHRDVAVKIIHTDLQSDPQFLSRFTQEGQHLTALHHANIVQVHDVTISRPSQPGSNMFAYIVSEYIVGQTLGDYLAQTVHKGKFPTPAEIVYLFTSLGVAIDYVHQQGIIHGNIKPSNILFNQENTAHLSVGEPMLTDFGLDQLVGNASSIPSPSYISPEQAKGQPASNRSDIYALGVLLYELCTGVQPFRDSSSVAVMMQHINALPTPPILIKPTIPPALSEVILRAMAKDIATRFPLASLLGTAVADAYAIQSTVAFSTLAAQHGNEEAHQGVGGPQATILGVSQPLPQLPSQAFGSRPATRSQPLPPISQPLPPLPMVSGTHPVVSPAAQAPTTSRKLPTPPVQTPAVSTSSGSIPVITPHPENMPFLSGTSPTMPVTTQDTPVHSPSFRQTASPLPSYIPVPPGKRAAQKWNVPLYAIIAILVLLLLVVIASIGVNLFLHRPDQPGTIVGHAFFQDDALGHDDLLRIDLQTVTAPPSGKQQVAWLQENNHSIVRLGILQVQNGSATLMYTGDTQHINLLSIIQRVFVTLENSANQSSTPKGTTLYAAQFDPTWFPYLKNILYSTPDLPPNTGIVTGIIDTLKSIDDKASSIVDSLRSTRDYALAQRQATRIIELLEGTQYAVSSGDQPATVPSMLSAPIGLFSSPAQKGYLEILSAQLDKLQQSSASNATLQAHIQHVRSAVDDLQDWLQKMRGYDVHLLKAASLNDPALVGVALQLKQVAADSYTGRTLPPNAGPQPISGSAGAYQAYVECQYMATLEMKLV